MAMLGKTAIGGENADAHADFRGLRSGQLRFRGLCMAAPCLQFAGLTNLCIGFDHNHPLSRPANS
jgi:hypothetical protein